MLMCMLCLYAFSTATKLIPVGFTTATEFHVSVFDLRMLFEITPLFVPLVMRLHYLPSPCHILLSLQLVPAHSLHPPAACMSSTVYSCAFPFTMSFSFHLFLPVSQKKRQEIIKLSTGSKKLDALLGGGIETGT